MKLTARQLRRIINEELKSILSEGPADAWADLEDEDDELNGDRKESSQKKAEEYMSELAITPMTGAEKRAGLADKYGVLKIQSVKINGKTAYKVYFSDGKDYTVK